MLSVVSHHGLSERLFIVILTVLWGQPGAATPSESDRLWLQQLNQQLSERAAMHQTEAHQIVENSFGALDKQRADSRHLIEQTAPSPQPPHGTRCPVATPVLENQSGDSEPRYPHVMVLVSFSMPLATLKALAQQLQTIGGTLVFRGLVNNSFKQTARRLQQLGYKAQIDPTVFQALNVVHVPVFVHFATPPHTMTTRPPYDLVRGHISLDAALALLQQQGHVGGLEGVLQTLRGH